MSVLRPIFKLSMIEKCRKCGMIRAIKDLVLLELGEYICFSCWNRKCEEKRKSSQS